jgi:hypothetical protein
LFLDPRSWSTQLYFLLMLPLGIAYFTTVVVGLALSLGLIAMPFLGLFGHSDAITLQGAGIVLDSPWSWVIGALCGVFILFACLHLVRLVGGWHGQLAKHLLVKSAQS